MSLTAEDRLDIQDLYARNAWAFDTGDVDGFVATFAQDAILDLHSRHEGHAAIRWLAQQAARHDPLLPHSQHLVTALTIEGDRDRAHAQAYVTRVHRLPGRTRNNCSVVWAGYEVDVLTRADGTWLFAHKAARAWQGAVVERIQRLPLRIRGLTGGGDWNMVQPGPLTVDDRLDIMDVAARYAWAMDGGLPDDYAGVFVPDAVHDPGQGRYLGHDAIRAMEANFPSDAAFPGSKHLVSQFIIEGNTERANVRMYVARFTAVPGTSSVEVAWNGFYTDTVVKVDGRWYFEQKKAHYPDELLLQQFGQEEAPGLRHNSPQFYDQIGLSLPKRKVAADATQP